MIHTHHPYYTLILTHAHTHTLSAQTPSPGVQRDTHTHTLSAQTPSHGVQRDTHTHLVCTNPFTWGTKRHTRTLSAQTPSPGVQRDTGQRQPQSVTAGQSRFHTPCGENLHTTTTYSDNSWTCNSWAVKIPQFHSWTCLQCVWCHAERKPRITPILQITLQLDSSQ